MSRLISQIRRPVRRPGAEYYLLVTLLSFAASVGLTRLFLQLTGYPQLGSGTLHIAHVLWGGLLLFIAALLPILLANRWVYLWTAVLAGCGVGLFIDEVGKFITQSNDYFFPPAAPIIYAFFLLTVLLYLQVRKPPESNPRSDLYTVLEGLEEVLDHDLDAGERDEIVRRLTRIAEQKDQPDLNSLAIELLDFLDNQEVVLVPDRPNLLEHAMKQWQAFEQHHLHRWIIRAVLIGGMLALAINAWLDPIRMAVAGFSTPALIQGMGELLLAGRISLGASLKWFIGMLALQAVIGLLLLVSAGFLAFSREERGIRLGFLCLLLELAGVDLFVFYFDQFSTILLAGIQFILLLGVIHYRRRFLNKPSVTI